MTSHSLITLRLLVVAESRGEVESNLATSGSLVLMILRWRFFTYLSQTSDTNTSYPACSHKRAKQTPSLPAPMTPIFIV